MKWQVSFPQTLHVKRWDDEAIVYDAQSGNTHLLGAVATEVLAELLASPQDADSLTAMLFPEEANQTGDNAKESLEAILSQLAGISLISPVAH
ncbi:PqqD family protein of HPr-rel-A system [Paucimonas lemoignei]|uniref:PqqD family protein of HPr-rel-A system n=1 Tax=Paucimonas lemoignei TaxID=29443 RepID=A0A4R3I087_PAULE|nr:HPr-rel-A system PqqD family peptide chaperone [Paucimonas lemoignei]TCS38584.1 PqqD family protein of HPr-rel-A system [Paucimonas lemoignei]